MAVDKIEKFFVKRLIGLLFGSLIIHALSCSNKSSETVFQHNVNTIEDATKDGYQRKKRVSPISGQTEYSDMNYYKVFGDTVINLQFLNKEIARKEIVFNRNKVDSNSLFEKLFEKGFIRIDSSDDGISKFIMIEPIKKIRYNVYFNKKQIAFL